MEGTGARADRANGIQLNLLGPEEARLDGRPILFRTRKSLALLAYLALDPGPHFRERLADLLWPRADVTGARASLRTALIYVRHALGPLADSVIMATRESLGVRPGAPLDLDVDALTEAQRLARNSQGKTTWRQVEVAAAEYRGCFLAGMVLPDAPDFEAWVETQRTYWRGVESELLDRLATRQMVGRDPAAAITTLERWTSLNPDEETAWQRLINAHVRMGDAAGARRARSAYHRAMAALDAEPSNEMAELRNQILGSGDAKRLDAVRRESAKVRLELKTTVGAEHAIPVPELGFAV